MHKQKLIIALSLAFTLAACGGEEKPAAKPETPAAPAASVAAPAAVASTPPPAAEVAPAVAANPLTDAAALQKAQDQLQALPQFAGKELNVFQNVLFYDNNYKHNIKVDVQDPDKPENIDHYEYSFKDGKWSEPSPVQLSGGGDMKPNLTPLKDVRFADVAEKFISLYQQTVEKEKLTPKLAVPDHVVFVLVVHNQDRFWQAPLDTDRAQMFLRMKPDGTLKSLEK
ncbi:hypothetical protein ACKLNO_11315 [Neisseriaceae bacterium B1]